MKQKLVYRNMIFEYDNITEELSTESLVDSYKLRFFVYINVVWNLFRKFFGLKTKNIMFKVVDDGC
jgi:hypothetical protein